jgi:hypothetical protein
MRMVMAVPHSEAGYAHNPTVPPAHAIDPGDAKLLIAEEAGRRSASSTE